MKKYLIWIWLLLKRLLKKPAFLCLLTVMPVLATIFGLLRRETDNKLTVGIVWEESATAVDESVLTAHLTDSVSIFDFHIYDNVDALIWDVKGEKISCGFVIPEDIVTHLTDRTWQKKIVVYIGEDESIAQIAKEKLASALFTIYAEDNYVNLIKEAVKGTAVSDREIVDFAMTAYETHLADGSTFALSYETGGQEKTERTAVQSKAERSLNGQKQTGRNLSERLMTASVSLTPLRGILAVCVFLCGICGLLTDCKDRQSRRFARVASNWMTAMVNIWIPMIPASLMMLVSLYISLYVSNNLETAARIGEMRVGTEMMRLLIYQFLIIFYCSIIRVVLRKREQIAVIIPILTIGSLICSPVWVRLALYLPVFRILEKIFPVTWYLLL